MRKLTDSIREHFRTLRSLEDDVFAFENSVRSMREDVNDLKNMWDSASAVEDHMRVESMLKSIQVMKGVSDDFLASIMLGTEVVLKWAHPRKYPKLMWRVRNACDERDLIWLRLAEIVNTQQDLMEIEEYANTEGTR